MPNEQKESWINLLPIMTQDQVDTLLQILQQEHDSYRQSGTQLMEDLKKLEGDLTTAIDKLKVAERQAIEDFVKDAMDKHQRATQLTDQSATE